MGKPDGVQIKQNPHLWMTGQADSTLKLPLAENSRTPEGPWSEAKLEQ